MIILALALKWWRETAITALVVVAVTMFELHEKAVEERGRFRERIRVADSTLAVLRPRLAKADVAVVHDTVRVRTTLARLDTVYHWMHDTVTTWRRDTVYAPTDTARTKPSVLIPVGTLTVYDSLAVQCRDLANSCSVFRTTANATIAPLETKGAAFQVRSCTTPTVIGSLLGAAGGFYLGSRRPP